MRCGVHCEGQLVASPRPKVPPAATGLRHPPRGVRVVGGRPGRLCNRAASTVVPTGPATTPCINVPRQERSCTARTRIVGRVATSIGRCRWGRSLAVRTSDRWGGTKGAWSRGGVWGDLDQAGWVGVTSRDRVAVRGWLGWRLSAWVGLSGRVVPRSRGCQGDGGPGGSAARTGTTGTGGCSDGAASSGG